MPTPFKVVILCEKPNQARTFASAYKLNQTKIIDKNRVAYYDREGGMCSVHLSGHLLELMPPQYYVPSLDKTKKGWNLDDLPVIPGGSRWKLQPKYNSSAKERTRIKSLLAGIKWAMIDVGSPGEIAIAVDNDREGELLGWETLEFYGLTKHKNITRLMYSQVNEKTLIEAFDRRGPGSEWFTRYLAGLARSYADWLIGMNVTMAMSVDNKLMIPPFTTLNSGRVVYAICYILYVRSMSIKNYKPVDYYSEVVTFKTSSDGVYVGRVSYPDKVLNPVIKKLTDKSLAGRYHDYILKIGKGTVVRYDEDKKRTAPPGGFHRTGFDRHMIRKHGMGLDDIAGALQTLYDEKGLVTYPRVDVKKLDIGMHADMPAHISAMSKNLTTAPQLTEQERDFYKKIFSVTDAKKISPLWEKGIAEGESHHAIIPTDQALNLKGLTKNEFLVYRELADRLIAQFLPDYEYASTIIETQVGQLICKTTGKTPLRNGWKVLAQDMEELDKNPDDEDGDAKKLPKLAIGQEVNVKGADTKTSVTTEPKNYTVDELLADLENPRKFVSNKDLVKKIKDLKIGTDGTRQAHITGLQPKGFALFEKRKGKKAVLEIVPTKKLLSLMEVAPSYFKHPETSAYWEDAFSSIQKGEMSLESFLAKQVKFINLFFSDLQKGNFKLKSPITDVIEPCRNSECKGHLFFRKLPKKNFDMWSCSGCDAAHFDEKGVVGSLFGEKKKRIKEPDWVPPKGAARKNCPECSKFSAYHRKVEGKSWSLWECLECKSSFFDQKGEIGKKKDKNYKK